VEHRFFPSPVKHRLSGAFLNSSFTARLAAEVNR